MRNINVKLCISLRIVTTLFFAACSEDSNGWSAKDVCPEDGVNAYGMANRGTFTDERDGQVYKYTTIGDQVWMAQNLNHIAEYSACYDNNDLNCDFWGRFYSLQEYGISDELLNYAMIDSICPTGWHVPSIDEWRKMINLVGKFEDEKTATILKSSELWSPQIGNGTNDCGFNALPGGVFFKTNDVFQMYREAIFWTSTMKNRVAAYTISIHTRVSEGASLPKMHIRCLKD